MDLDKHLLKAENQWLKSSFDFIKAEFSKKPLPSHDHHHHLRVWNHAKKILLELARQNIQPEYDFTEGLLLSCMFHDSGMAITYDTRHGSASLGIFNRYLEEQRVKPIMTEEIKQVIESHDDKTYTLAGRLIKNGKPQLLPALHISDDLDALGNIGIYRYSEIYLMRGIPFEDLGLKIIANLSGRFGNFMSNCSRMPEMVMEHSIRHHTIESFFRSYNLQVRKIEETGEEQMSGPMAVVKNIYRQVLMNAPDIESICDNMLASGEDVYIQNFFKALKNEI